METGRRQAKWEPKWRPVGKEYPILGLDNKAIFHTHSWKEELLECQQHLNSLNHQANKKRLQIIYSLYFNYF